jgi:hypothetical protein
MTYKTFEQLITNQKIVFYPGAGKDFETLLMLHCNMFEWDPETNARLEQNQFLLKSNINPNGMIPVMVDCSEEEMYHRLMNFVEGRPLDDTDYMWFKNLKNVDFEDFYNNKAFKLNENLLAKCLYNEEIYIPENKFQDIILKIKEAYPEGREWDWIESGLKGQVIYWQITNLQQDTREIIPFFYFLNWDIVMLSKLAQLNVEISGIIYSCFRGFGSSGILPLDSDEYFNQYIYPINIPNWICVADDQPLFWPCYSLPTNRELDEKNKFPTFIQTPYTSEKEHFLLEKEKWGKYKLEWEKSRDIYREEKA